MKMLTRKWGLASWVLILSGLLNWGCNTTNQATTTTKTENISNLSQNEDWIFTASTALPQIGQVRQVTADYTVRFSHSKLIVYLPYFGRAYTGADLLSGHGALDFTSTNFTIQKNAKKGQWNITIIPKDYKEVQSMDFTFYDNGTAYLSVSMQNRSSINFNGNVEQVKS